MKNRRAVSAFVTLTLMIMMMIGMSAVQIQAAANPKPAPAACPVVGDVCETEENCGPNPDCYCNTAAKRCRSVSTDFAGF